MWPWPTMVSKVTWGSDIIDFILFEFLHPENHILDTEITSLSFIDPEIIEHICVGGHLGRHLEFWTPATGERYSPLIFENCTLIRRKWDQSHLLIIITATGMQVAEDYTYYFFSMLPERRTCQNAAPLAKFAVAWRRSWIKVHCSQLTTEFLN